MTRDTVLCISVSRRPGHLGTAVHNAGYAARSLDYVYKACATTDIGAAMAGVRALGIRGCSVSMPFKQTVMAHLDNVDDRARAIGAVNTVVNENGRLIGYNTDVDGAAAALETLQVKAHDIVLLLGAGGMARAFAFAMEQRGVRPLVCSRTLERASSLTAAFSGRAIGWENRESQVADIVINATPIGMDAHDESPVSAPLAACRGGIDAVISESDTAFLRTLRHRGTPVVPGAEIGLSQAAAQFVRYTGVDAPIDEMRLALREVVGR